MELSDVVLALVSIISTWS